ncbi:MAG: DUF5606 domain-containing protein [Flavobacteriaceae bacterium]|nr:DUF5606 domain-containing protein [Flavobacteriaceae bacterium]
MDFSKIIAVTGKPGLFEVLSQTKTGVIVKSLNDDKRFPITSTQNLSLLENIVIFTNEDEVRLLTIFKSMFEKEEGKPAMSHKESSAKLISYFSEVLPDYDQERVYTSNIKKVIQWYNALVGYGFDFSKIEIASEKNTEEN